MRSELSLTGSGVPAQVQPQQASVRSRIFCREARSPDDRADHLSIRRQIFVHEQEVFAESDLDAHDRDGSAIALLGYCDGIVAGTVRLYVLDADIGLWQGDRLAVLAPYRTKGVGAPLVRCAVATAATLGGRRMTAHIQPSNVAFFQRLGWSRVGESEIYAGLVHQRMDIMLPSRVEGSAIVRKLAGAVSARDR